MDAIADSEMCLKIQQSRPKVFNEAVKVAVELEAFDKAERQRQGNKYVRGTAVTSVSTDSSSEHSTIQPLLGKLDKLLNGHERRKRPDGVTEGASPGFRCSKCKKLGRFKRNCPLNKTPSTEDNVMGRNAEGEANTKRVGRTCNKALQERRVERQKILQQDLLKLECICLSKSMALRQICSLILEQQLH